MFPEFSCVFSGTPPELRQQQEQQQDTESEQVRNCPRSQLRTHNCYLCSTRNLTASLAKCSVQLPCASGLVHSSVYSELVHSFVVWTLEAVVASFALALPLCNQAELRQCSSHVAWRCFPVATIAAVGLMCLLLASSLSSLFLRLVLSSFRFPSAVSVRLHALLAIMSC